MFCKYAVGASGVEHMHVGILCFQPKQFVGSVLKGAWTHEYFAQYLWSQRSLLIQELFKLTNES